MLTRRQFLDNATLLGAGTALSALLPPWARSAASPARSPAGGAVLSGQEFDLEIAPTTVEIDGQPGRAITVNGQLPAPLLRWREGDDITLRVTNRLEEDTSIHWHGILL
ncbi:MAG: multicopper oxidase domain-containing protein, partial [Alphaproteobacteria bacterium]